MKYLSYFFCLLAASLPVHADWFYKLVTYKCDHKQDRLVIGYIGAYNEEGKSLVEDKGKDAWDPWELVEFDESGDRIKNQKTIKRTCRLSDGSYNVEIGPAPGNQNIQGRCGAHMSAWIKFSRHGKLLGRRVFEGDCHDMESPIVTEFSISPRNKKIQSEGVIWHDFYR